MTIARYSFLPWLRRGIANRLQAGAVTTSRAAVDVTLTAASDVAATPLPPRRVHLAGPGDIVGINPQAVVRTEPRRWITDFEPNYLAFIEFYDEDFAWRYTPTGPDGAQHRLTPWITLLVLKETEFVRNASPARPLASITLSPGAVNLALPPESQLWAWAHVHLNAGLSATSTPDPAALGSLLRDDPDRGYCRLLSPRRLEANTAYYAFVIPTFEVGRKAGIGDAVADTESGLALSWAGASEFPVYYEWFFRTGTAGDFESLVRALKPRPIDRRVGIRDLDIQQPGFLLPPIISAPDDVVGLEGAILAPTSEPKPLDPASNFPTEIEGVVNLAAAVEAGGVTDGDPVVTAPLYGRWHALVQRISADPSQRNWVNELNLDPRWRSAAGFGTQVIQKNQEEYMKLAWQQIGEILAANRRIHFAQVAMQASQRAFVKHLAPLPDDRALAVTAPVFRKVMGSPVTVHHLLEQSRLPRVALSGAFRKQLRPRGAIARRTFAARPAGVPLAAVVTQLNSGAISGAPPRVSPAGPTVERFAEKLAPRIGPAVVDRVVDFVANLAVRLGASRLEPRQQERDLGHSIAPTALTAEVARRVPVAPRFVLAPAGRAAPIVEPPSRAGTADSPDARDFRSALVNFHALLAVRVEPPAARAPLPLAGVRATVLSAVEPARSFPRRVAPLLRVGSRPLDAYVRDTYRDAGPSPPAERIVPVMAYPDIRTPMYQALRDISSELLVPNLKLIAPNTISLMVRNQAFIEAYMIGLNHEFARELLWREYPTDQRPSSFRQFWDAANALNSQHLEPAAFEESLRDVIRLHAWPSASYLGEHDNRRKPGHPPESAGTPLLARPVILVVRGDLLKRYPNTVIYAQRARWGDRSDNALRLVLWDETGEKSESDPTNPNLRFPLYQAFVGPDIHFIGFDFSVDEARGDPSLAETAEAKAAIPAERLGWFFVLKQVVGEPRFGLDEHPPEAPSEVKWDNLSWDNLGTDVKLIDLAQPFASPPLGSDAGGVAWGTNAADLAFILYQKPVLVGVHARDMLRDLT